MIRTTNRTGAIAVDKLLTHVRLPLYRNAYALMASTAGTAVLGLVYWVLAARYYPADTVGLNAAVISMMTFLAGVAQLPFMNAVLRYIPVAGRATRRLVVWAYLISLLLAAAIGLLYLLSVDFWSPILAFLRHDAWLGGWFFVGVLAWTIFVLQDNVLTGLREAIWVPIENIPYAIVKLGLLVWFAAGFPAYGILASWTFPLVLVLIPVNYLVFAHLIPRHVHAHRDQTFTHTLREIAHYVTGNYIGALFLLAATRLLPVLVASLAGATANAYFYLPWTVATALKQLVVNTSTSFTVEVATDPTKLRAYSYRYLRQTLLVLLGPVLLIVVAAPQMLSFSGGEYAAEGTPLLRMLTVASLPNVITSLYLGIARVRQRVTGIILVQLALCVLTLGLSYLFLGRYGITGVGFAILLTETLVAVGVLITGLWPILCAPLVRRLWGARG